MLKPISRLVKTNQFDVDVLALESRVSILVGSDPTIRGRLVGSADCIRPELEPFRAGAGVSSDSVSTVLKKH